jgi:hypothetical protein
MANVRLPAATRNAIVAAVRDLIDADVGAGTIKLYTGTQPATGGGSIGASTLIGTLTFSDPCASSPTGGTLTFSTITDDSSADAPGTITWARIADYSGDTVFDCDVTATGGGGTIVLSSVTAAAGDILRITSFTLTQPAG